MTDLQALQQMLARIGISLDRGTMIHKKNPGWASAERIIFDAANTRLCFSFDKNDDLINISWGPWQDQV